MIVKLRKLRMTAAEIAETLAMPLSTVSGILTGSGWDDESTVGDLGLVGEFFFKAVLRGCGEDRYRVALAFASLGAGQQFELADLFAHERGPGEGVARRG